MLIMLECVYKPNLQSSSSPHDGSSACLFVLPIRWRTLTYNPQDQIRNTRSVLQKKTAKFHPPFTSLCQVKHVGRMWYVIFMWRNANVPDELGWSEKSTEKLYYCKNKHFPPHSYCSQNYSIYLRATRRQWKISYNTDTINQ